MFPTSTGGSPHRDSIPSPKQELSIDHTLPKAELEISTGTVENLGAAKVGPSDTTSAQEVAEKFETLKIRASLGDETEGQKWEDGSGTDEGGVTASSADDDGGVAIGAEPQAGPPVEGEIEARVLDPEHGKAYLTQILIGMFNRYDIINISLVWKHMHGMSMLSV